MYHISRHFLGETATFEPRIPVSQNETEEVLAPRICASDDISKCWMAIRGCNDLFSAMRKAHVTGFYFFIYKFDNTSSFEKSPVFDADRTNEHISYKKEKAVLVDVIYIKSHKLVNGYELSNIKEHASFEEAINAYNEYQKEELLEIEKKL